MIKSKSQIYFEKKILSHVFLVSKYSCTSNWINNFNQGRHSNYSHDFFYSCFIFSSIDENWNSRFCHRVKINIQCVQYTYVPTYTQKFNKCLSKTIHNQTTRSKMIYPNWKTLPFQIIQNPAIFFLITLYDWDRTSTVFCKWHDMSFLFFWW